MSGDLKRKSLFTRKIQKFPRTATKRQTRGGRGKGRLLGLEKHPCVNPSPGRFWALSKTSHQGREPMNLQGSGRTRDKMTTPKEESRGGGGCRQ